MLTYSELIWGIYAVIAAIEDSGCEEWTELGKGWQAWLDYAKTTAAKVSMYDDNAHSSSSITETDESAQSSTSIKPSASTIQPKI